MVWIVGITNAFNLLDNMDGLSAGVAAICAAAFYFVALDQGSPLVALLSAATAGAAVGFLLHNLHPARIFLGDTGSLLLGFMVAAISVQGVYLGASRLTHLPIITPILILGVPLFDTFSVMAIRIAEGRSIFAADKRHFSHRLVDLGMSHRQAVVLVWLVTIATAMPATLLSGLFLHEALTLLAQEAILFLIIVLLMRAGAVRAAAPPRTPLDA
jgi:UDP-GlcNAc:undecaprenyl-phosphate GlcNAc-1-phosphate transferase